jgi:ligand-binding sensor domain-containing protein
MERPSTTFRQGRVNHLLLLAIAAALLLVFGVLAAFNSQRTLTRSARSAAIDGRLAFTLRTLDPGMARGLRFEPVASTPRYSTGAFFAGDLYLAGPSGLTVFAGEGKLKRTLRTGVELPVAPITAVASGRLRGTHGPQLLLATDGAGLLLLEPNGDAAPTLHQLLPARAEAAGLTALLPLSTGDLLLGTRQHGLLLYNGQTLAPLSFSLPGIDQAKLQVTALAAVDAASYLLGTRNQGVFYVHAGTAERTDAASGLPDDQVEALAVRGHRAYVGTPVGTAELDLEAPGLHPTRVLAKGLFGHVLAVSQDQLAVGTLDQGVRQIPLAGPAHLLPASISAGPSSTVSNDRVDAFLAAPDALYALIDGALVRRTGTGWTPVLAPSATSQTLTDNNISALAFAPDGTLYVGFFDRGLDLLLPNPGAPVRHLEDDHLFCINQLALDPERHIIAAATANGLVLFDQQGTPRQTLTRRDGLISDHVTDIAFTSSGTALATPAGLTFLTPRGPESLYGFQGLINNHVYALAAKQNQLLAGTLGGLSVLNAETVTRSLTVANSGLKHNWITALLPISNGYLVGTYGAGIETLDSQGQFTPVELPTGTPRELVINPNAIFATATHTYAGTLGHGLLLYNAATARWSAVTSGLPSLNVTAFAARDGQLYMGTEDGLVRIAEADLP